MLLELRIKKSIYNRRANKSNCLATHHIKVHDKDVLLFFNVELCDTLNE